jgi:hypothetical protein
MRNADPAASGPDDVNTVIDAAPRFGAPPTRAVT